MNEEVIVDGEEWTACDVLCRGNAICHTDGENRVMATEFFFSLKQLVD